MRAPGLSLITAVSLGLAAALAGCSGGNGGSTPAAPVPSAGPSAPAGAATATISFDIPLPSGAASPNATHRKPQYIGKSTQSISIAITGGPSGTTTYPTVVAKKQCNSTGCFFAATDSLPVQTSPYTFVFTAQGKHGTLSQGTAVQTLVRGSNSVDVTLSPVVATAGIALPKATPVPGGPSSQTFAVTVTPLDADGNTITGTQPFATPFPVSVFEVDNQAAYSLVAGKTGSAACSAGTCTLQSLADSVVLTYSGTANAFSADPGYFPAEAIVYDGTPATAGSIAFSRANSAAISTAQCTKPAPLCVYAQPYYPLLLAGIPPTNTGVIFPAYFLSVAGSTIWTDAGLIETGGTAPSFLNNKNATSSETLGGIEVQPSASQAFSVDYSQYGGDTPQLIDSITSAGTVHTFSYAGDSVNSTSAQGGGVILGPDGNLWWIDPVTASLRYASPASPASAKVCGLAPASASESLSAAEIAGTPAGVAPARIWFSSVDDVSGGSYVGYVTAATCGNATYVNIDNTDTTGPPNGLAVDANGNAWYNDGENLTDIGEVTVSGSGALAAPAAIALPAAFQNAGQAWGIVLGLADGNLYFATDNGLIGRFAPSAGPAKAVAYALPGPIANTADDVSGPNYNSSDTSCGTTLSSTNVIGPCFPQFTWDPGSGGAGRVSLIIPAIESTFSTTTNTESVIASLDLSNSAVTFSASTRSLRSHAFHYGRPKHGASAKRRRFTGLR